MINKGFILKSGKAIYPTHLKILEIELDKERILGRIRDNDDHNYFLSIETEKLESKANCGYNEKGDLVII